MSKADSAVHAKASHGNSTAHNAFVIIAQSCILLPMDCLRDTRNYALITLWILSL